MAASIGPGWECYLDRLVAGGTGRDPSAIDVDDHYPAASDHYPARSDHYRHLVS